MTRHPLRSTLSVALVATTLTLAGCGDEIPGSDAGASPSTAAESSSPPVVEPEPQPLPLLAHVLPADAIAGYAADGDAEVLSLAEFADAHGKTPAELRASGFVEAAALQMAPVTGEGFAMSISAVYATPEQAQAEGERLFAANSEPDPGSSAELVDVPGAPDVDAVRLTGRKGRKAFTGVETVFVDGAVLHEVFAVGVDPLLDVDALLAVVADLHDEVVGHPLAE